MGQVWLASDQVLGRLVAIKLLRPEYAEHPETLERFRAEARHAGLLSHPHIAQVYDYGHSGPFREPYLVMEYIEGPSLADVIEREPLSAEFTCEVAAQAAEGLAAAHRAHLVHRDIKPGNLLLTPDGRVKVTDFGIAYAAGSAPITAPGIVMGTSLYMAPERIAGGPGTPASDLYSLGIVMWECLVGRPPFRGPATDVMAAHLHQALPALPAWVPAPICEVVARLTAKDLRYRLSDAGLVAEHLRAIVDQLPAEDHGAGSGPGSDTQGNSRPGEVSTGPARPGGRRQGATVAVASIVVAGLTAGGLAAWGTFGASLPAEQDVAGPSATVSGAPAGWVGYVTLRAFHGQQYATVSNWLREHGLTPQIAWADDTGLATGTVVSVAPTGLVPVGSTVTVTIAWDSATPPPGVIPAPRPGAGPGTSTGPASIGPGGGTGSHAAPSGPAPAPTPTGAYGPSGGTGGTAGGPATTPASLPPTGVGIGSPGGWIPTPTPSFCLILPHLCYSGPWAREAPQHGDQERLIGGPWVWREDHPLKFEGYRTMNRIP